MNIDFIVEDASNYVDFEIDFTEELDFELDSVVVIQEGEIYTGSYEVTPMTYPQYLETQNKMMTDDVTVYEIPYSETSNVYGTTVVIAS